MSYIVHTRSSVNPIGIAGVLGDAAIVWALSFIGGAVIGIAEHGKSLLDMMPALALSNSLTLTVGFMISGARNPPCGGSTSPLLHLLFGQWVQLTCSSACHFSVGSLASSPSSYSCPLAEGLSYLFTRSESR
jgi:hypothetical protein